MTQSQNAQTLYQDIMEYIEDAYEITERGEFVELSSLDARVEQLCLNVQQLSVEESMQFRPKLEEMMSQLAQLQATFSQKRADLGELMTEVGKHKQAAMAYKQQEASAGRSFPLGDDADDQSE